MSANTAQRIELLSPREREVFEDLVVGRSNRAIADKAYDARAIRKTIADEGALAVIPTKINAKTPIPHDVNLYRMRNIVERFFVITQPTPDICGVVISIRCWKKLDRCRRGMSQAFHDPPAGLETPFGSAEGRADS